MDFTLGNHTSQWCCRQSHFNALPLIHRFVFRHREAKTLISYLYCVHYTLNFELIQHRRNRSDDDVHRDVMNLLEAVRVDRPAGRSRHVSTGQNRHVHPWYFIAEPQAKHVPLEKSQRVRVFLVASSLRRACAVGWTEGFHWSSQT